MISGLITAGRFGYAALTGVDALVDNVAGYGVKLALKSHATDDEAGARMVEAMRAAAPVLTGNLVNGIRTYRADDGATVVEASALKVSGGVTWDYAPFVEFGTADLAPEPFFYTQAEQVLAERGTSLEDAAAAAGTEAGF